jgi:hypothetical protein
MSLALGAVVTTSLAAQTPVGGSTDPTFNNQPYQPLLNERACLTCHTYQNTCASCHTRMLLQTPKPVPRL